jgi:uncharacterized protein (TIGR03437 family)
MVATVSVAGANSPVITSVDPNPIDAAGPYFLMNINGSGFVDGSLINWEGQPAETTFVNESLLKLTVTGDMRTTSGRFHIMVTNPDGSKSNTQSVDIRPVIDTVTPSAALAGGPAVTITVTGLGFIPSDLLNLSNRFNLNTTFVSDRMLTAVVPAAALADASPQAYIEVLHGPTGITSTRTRPFPILAHPVITSVSPNTIDAGGPFFQLTLTGKNFVAGASASLGGVDLDTTYIPDTQLKVAVAAEVRALSGTFDLTVTSAPGITSVAYPMAISPVLASVSPPGALTTNAPLPITVTGVGFTRKDAIAVTVSGRISRLATTYVSSTTLRAEVPGGTLSAPVTVSIQVVDTAGPDVSASVEFPVRGTPVITSATPVVLDAGGSPVQLTVNGSGFVPASVLHLGETILGTTYVSPSQLTATLPASSRVVSGTLQLTVSDPVGGTSNAYPITISPVLFSIAPLSVAAFGPSVTITATGTGLTRSDVVALNGTRLATTYLSPTSLSAVIPATLLTTPGNAAVQVLDPAGAGRSQAQSLTIAAPVPAIAALSPSAVAAGSGFTLTITGSGFYAASVMQWNGSPLTTTLLSGTQLSAQVPASLVQAAGSASITVVNPGVQASNSAALTVNPASAATIASLTPGSAVAGSSGLTLTLAGSGFAAGSTVTWNGATLATSFVNSARLTAVIPAGLLADAGTAQVMVTTPGAAASNVMDFRIDPPKPVISILTPASAAPGTSRLMLTIAGSNFAPGCVVQWNGTPLSTAFGNASQVTADVPGNLLVEAGFAAITVLNPGGVASAPASFAIVVPTPGLAAVIPAAVAAGSAAFTLTVGGTNFVPASVVRWNGMPLTTRFDGITQLSASVPAELVASAGGVQITVANPGGLISPPVVFAVTAGPVPLAITAVQNAFNGLPAASPGALISIYGAGFIANGTTATIDEAPVPLLYVGPSQINAQVPYETAVGSSSLVLKTAEQTATAKLEIAPTAPGILTTPSDGYAVAQNCGDGSLISATSPAAPGQCLTLYMTGQGALDHAVATGAAAPSDPLVRPVASVDAKLGGVPADLLFAGLAPGMTGVLQVNLVAPDVPDGDQPVEISIGGVAANRALLPMARK